MREQSRKISPNDSTALEAAELNAAGTAPTPSPTPPIKPSSKAPVLVFILLCGIWGSTWIFIKIGLRDLPPISFAGIRFVIAVCLLAPVIVARRPQLPRTWSDWKLLMITGVLGFTLNYGLLFW